VTLTSNDDNIAIQKFVGREDTSTRKWCAALFHHDTCQKRLQPVRERHAGMSKNRFLKALNRYVRFFFSAAGGDALTPQQRFERQKSSTRFQRRGRFAYFLRTKKTCEEGFEVTHAKIFYVGSVCNLYQTRLLCEHLLR